MRAEGGESVRLIERVVETICLCFRKLKGEKDFPDINVQLQVIKVRRLSRTILEKN